MSSFFPLQPHASSSRSQHPPLALPTLDPQSHHTAFHSAPPLTLHPTGSILPLPQYPHHSTFEQINYPHPEPNEVTGPAAPVPYLPTQSTSPSNGYSTAPGAPQSRQKTSSVPRTIKAKAKNTAAGGRKPPHSRIQGIELETLPCPLYWNNIPGLGPIIPGPEPEFLSHPRFSKGSSPMPGWIKLVVGAMMTRRCKNPLEVIITIAEFQEWRVWMAGKGVTWHQKLSTAYDHASHLISRARPPIPKVQGYYHITDPDMHKLPPRPDKNKPKSRRGTVQDDEEGTAVAPSPTSTPFLSPVTTGTSPSTVSTGPPTPALQSSAPDLVDNSQYNVYGQNDDQGYEMGSLTRPAPQVPATSYQSSYQQVSGMDASLGAGSMTPLAFSWSSPEFDFLLAGQSMNYASGEGYDELAQYQFQNIMDQFTYRSW